MVYEGSLSVVQHWFDRHATASEYAKDGDGSFAKHQELSRFWGHCQSAEQKHMAHQHHLQKMNHKFPVILESTTLIYVPQSTHKVKLTHLFHKNSRCLITYIPALPLIDYQPTLLLARIQYIKAQGYTWRYVIFSNRRPKPKSLYLLRLSQTRSNFRYRQSPKFPRCPFRPGNTQSSPTFTQRPHGSFLSHRGFRRLHWMQLRLYELLWPADCKLVYDCWVVPFVT